MPDPTIAELAAWCRREAEVKRASERQMKGIVDNVAAKHAAEAARYETIAAALERAGRLEAALAAIDEHARPVNWDDADDPQQAAAWRVLDAALGKTDESIADMVRALQSVPGSRWHESADPVADLLAERRGAALTPPAEKETGR